MINLMYLVLTALLAMNVSKEVINAFTIVDKSIENSNANIDNKNASTMVNLGEALKNPKNEAEKKEKITTAIDLAEKAQATSKAMIDKLDSYRAMIVERAGGMAPNDDGEMRIKREDDLEAATSYMIAEGKGEQMKNELTTFKKELADYVNNLPDNMRLSREEGSFAEKLPLNLEVDGGGDWAESMFTMVPAVAAVTIIDKYKNDVKNSESAVLDELWANAMGEATPRPTVVKKDFNKFGVIASLDNSYALPGQTINMRAMLGAYNANSAGLRIWINGRQVSAKDGIADMKIKANSKPGKHSVRVRAQYLKKGKNDQDGTGVWTSVPEETINYFVGQPQASISLDKMKVFYKGLKNPMTIAASGVPLNDLSVKAGPNISLQKTGPGKYNVLASKNSGKTWVEITGKRSDGSTENFGKIEYRLGRVPDPVAYVAQKTGGAIPVNAMKLQKVVTAKLLGFPYDLEYKVTSFTMFHVPRRGEAQAPLPVKGRLLQTSGPKAVLDRLKVGDRLYFEDVRAVGPDGETRKLGGLSFYFPN
jgi:gliding motility-associated protein GldM